MENIFYLFPVKGGLQGSHAHNLLQRATGADEDAAVGRMVEVCQIDADLQAASANKRGYYFSENMKEYCAEVAMNGSYPSALTRVRKRFHVQMTDAAVLMPDAGERCAVYQSPVTGKDYFVRVAACGLTGVTEGTLLCVLPADADHRTIDVQVADSTMTLEGRTADFVNIADWIASHHHPARTFEANPKHDYEHRVKGGDLASAWLYDDATSQSYLDHAFVDGKRLVYCGEGDVALIFDEHTANHFHGHQDTVEKVSNPVRKLMKRLA